MAGKQARLGRGLGALIKEVPREEAPAAPAAAAGSDKIPVDRIKSNPWQPRRTFAPEALSDLVHSIRDHGVLQPLIVRKVEGGYQLIAGERRLTAAREVGLKEVPAIVREVSDQEALELALIENLQREDLNLIEEAEGYRVLCDKFNLTQEQVAERVGKGRATVTNALRVLHLPDSVKELIARNKLSAGHAKVILGLEIPQEQASVAARAVRDELSVRALEKLIARMKKAPRKPRVSKADIPDSHLRFISDRLHQHFGTGVSITPCKTLANGKKMKGRIEIDFYSSDDLDRLLSLLGLTEDL